MSVDTDKKYLSVVIEREGYTSKYMVYPYPDKTIGYPIKANDPPTTVLQCESGRHFDIEIYEWGPLMSIEISTPDGVYASDIRSNGLYWLNQVQDKDGKLLHIQ